MNKTTWILALIFGTFNSPRLRALPIEFESLNSCNPGSAMKGAVQDGEDRACIEVKAGPVAKVCKRRSTADLRPGEGRIEYLNEKGELLVTWNTGLMMGDVRDFEAQAPSSHEGAPTQLLVASRKSESSGIGIQDWDVVQLDPSTMRLSELASVQDFGEGSFVKTDASPECFLLQTRFNRGKTGSYWTAELKHVDFNGQWVRVAGTSPRSARYTKSLEDFRLGTQISLPGLDYGRRSPLAWFQPHPQSPSPNETVELFRSIVVRLCHGKAACDEALAKNSEGSKITLRMEPYSKGDRGVTAQDLHEFKVNGTLFRSEIRIVKKTGEKIYRVYMMLRSGPTLRRHGKVKTFVLEDLSGLDAALRDGPFPTPAGMLQAELVLKHAKVHE